MVMKWGKLLFRGGTSPDDDTLPEVENEQQSPMDILTPNSARREDIHAVSKPRKSRHTFDMILDLRKRSSVSGNDESLALRKLITSRANDYFLDLQESVDANENKLPHPTKLLHYLAPKVPAIKQSPDVNLRIHSAKSDMDSGVAACIIGTLAHACEIYDKEIIKRSETEKPKSSAPEITTDRRFEQLVECVLSGVNVKKRKRESLMRRLEKNSEGTTNIEEILDEEDAQEDEGLKSRDACRAAWGIAVLGAYHLDTLGDVKVLDLLLALSLRIRESLLARLQLLRQDDLLSDTSDTTTEERMEELAEELAEDAVSAMWTFACVKACTGMRSVPLFETCCSILCQNPVEMRRRAQEAVDYENVHPNIGTSDVIDRLARSEAEVEVAPENSTKIDNSVEDGTEKDTLLDWLSPTEVNDMLWALALHGSSNSSSASDENILSETASTLREIAFDRILDWLQQDLKPSVENDEDKIALGDQPMSVEVVDAATLLSSQGPSSTNSTNDLIETMSIEDITLNSLVTGNGADIQEVEVVDAAALLASMKKDGPVDVETEVIMAPTTALDSVDTAREEANSASGAKIAGSYDEPESVYSKPNTTFSPHGTSS